MDNPYMKWKYEEKVTYCSEFVEIIKENLKKISIELPYRKLTKLLRNEGYEDTKGIFNLFDLMDTTSWSCINQNKEKERSNYYKIICEMMIGSTQETMKADYILTVKGNLKRDNPNGYYHCNLIPTDVKEKRYKYDMTEEGIITADYVSKLNMVSSITDIHPLVPYKLLTPPIDPLKDSYSLANDEAYAEMYAFDQLLQYMLRIKAAAANQLESKAIQDNRRTRAYQFILKLASQFND